MLARSGLQGLPGRPGRLPQRHPVHSRHPAQRGEGPRPPRRPGAAARRSPSRSRTRSSPSTSSGSRSPASTASVGAPMLNVRRVTLDAVLLDAAAAAGAEVRTRTNVTGLLEASGRVVGVETTGGALRAPLVVGADGARSTVARLVGRARVQRRRPARRIFTWGYFEGVDTERTVWLGRIGELRLPRQPDRRGALPRRGQSCRSATAPELRARPRRPLRRVPLHLAGAARASRRERSGSARCG